MNNKLITKTGGLFIAISQLLLFSITWYLDYNDIIFHTYRERGLYACIFIWLIIYLWLCSLYKAFSFASTSVGETVFSQFISFGLADLTLYIVCILLQRKYVSLMSGAFCVICQLGVACFSIIYIKRLLMKKMIPYRTVVIYGPTYSETIAKHFAKRLLQKYSHMFSITDIVFDSNDFGKLFVSIDEHERVILLGVNYEHRKEIAKRCIDTHKVFYFVPEIEEIVFMNCDCELPKEVALNPFECH